jgi:hypothetical protein
VWGCNPDNCLNNICDTDTGTCKDGCNIGLRGDYCEKGNITNRYWLYILRHNNDRFKAFTSVRIRKKETCPHNVGTLENIIIFVYHML